MVRNQPMASDDFRDFQRSKVRQPCCARSGAQRIPTVMRTSTDFRAARIARRDPSTITATRQP
jgi:hypothetical protein